MFRTYYASLHSHNIALGRDETYGQSIKLTSSCWRGLVVRENRPIKSLNHDTGPLLSFATSYDIS